MTEDRINFDRAKFNAIIAKHGYKQQQIDRIRGKQKWVSNKLKEDRGFFKEDLDWLQDLNNAMYQELMNTAIKTMTREREREEKQPSYFTKEDLEDVLSDFLVEVRNMHDELIKEMKELWK